MSHTCSVLHFLEMSHKYEKGNAFFIPDITYWENVWTLNLLIVK